PATRPGQARCGAIHSPLHTHIGLPTGSADQVPMFAFCSSTPADAVQGPTGRIGMAAALAGFSTDRPLGGLPLGLAERSRSHYVPAVAIAPRAVAIAPRAVAIAPRAVAIAPRQGGSHGRTVLPDNGDRASMNDLFDKTRPRRPDGPRPDGRVIAIRGAREHNLKNVDLEIPRDRLV